MCDARDIAEKNPRKLWANLKQWRVEAMSVRIKMVWQSRNPRDPAWAENERPIEWWMSSIWFKAYRSTYGGSALPDFTHLSLVYLGRLLDTTIQFYPTT